jgi:Tfp pilus assembly protein FimT
MKTKNRQSGISLIETTIVVAVIALLVGLSLPSVRGLFLSFESGTDAKTLVSAALASAKAIAVNQQRYAGIRFQQDVKGAQYLVFIVHDFDKTGLKNGFRAVDGTQPIKLPTTTGVMEPISNDSDIDQYEDIINTTTFSIIFSPSGNLVIHDVRVRNRDGQGDYSSFSESNDDIFNKKADVDAGFAMFYQDDYGQSDVLYLGLGEEPSRRSFIIYDKNIFKNIPEGSRWSDYLSKLDVVYLNPHTGTIIEK